MLDTFSDLAARKSLKLKS